MEHNWEQQREQLSALLDNELDEQERAELEAHLPTCAECRAELESLRRTKALVRALPQPALPRSFALPIEAPASAQPRQAAAARPAPAGLAARRTNRRPTVRTLQWISTIAAVLGIALLLSSAFSTISFSHDTASGAALNSAQQPGSAGQSTSATAPSPERTPADTQPGVGTAVPTNGQPGATPTNDQTNVGVHGAPSASSDTGATLISTTGLGGLLLLFSVCGFAIAWALRRRW